MSGLKPVSFVCEDYHTVSPSWRLHYRRVWSIFINVKQTVSEVPAKYLVPILRINKSVTIDPILQEI